MFPCISTMTLADDCSFSSGDESKWRFLGATGSKPLFEMALSPFCPLFNLPLVDLFLVKELSGSLCRMTWTAICGSGSGSVGGLLDRLASHYSFLTQLALVQQGFSF